MHHHFLDDLNPNKIGLRYEKPVMCFNLARQFLFCLRHVYLIVLFKCGHWSYNWRECKAIVIC